MNGHIWIEENNEFLSTGSTFNFTIKLEKEQ
jgi:hypothetical protein